MTAPHDPARFRVKTHKMPEHSLFYDRIMPGLFIALGVLTVVLIVFALGVVTGIVPWV